MMIKRKNVIRSLLVTMAALLMAAGQRAQADDVVFNTDVLDVKDRNNIDLSQFSRENYIVPDTYTLTVQVNKQRLADEYPVPFYRPGDDPKGSQACISPEIVKQLALKAEVQTQLTWWHDGQCLDLSSVKGMTATGDLSTSSLLLQIPQAYLEYSTPDWDPPSRWDDGIPGLLFDYNLNAQAQHSSTGNSNNNLSGNGTAGANMGAWRLRADWQAQSGDVTGNQMTWSRYYAYRAIRNLRATLEIGEDNLDTSIFDSFRYTGASLTSDDNMLPPNLRGYAPEIVGVASTNAKVTVSQLGRVLYETTVAPGPFRIQDISDAVSGQLDVRVEEQDGRVQMFQVNTASVPYLTRPGLVRYKLAAGRPSDAYHNVQGPVFSSGEFSWGVSNGWSLYGGAILSGDYNTLSAGVGRDLLALGALALDVTQSRAGLPGQGTLSGRSYRLSYSKNFDSTGSNVTFAGYRFSERDFMNMNDYLNARYNGQQASGSNKEQYSVTFSQQLRSLGLSAYLSYYRNTYWDQAATDSYNLSLSRNFDLGRFKNASVSLTAYRNRSYGMNDNGGYLSVSLPWGNSGTLSYNASRSQSGNSSTVGYYNRIDDNNNYQLQAGVAQHDSTVSGNYTHDGSAASVTVGASYQSDQYSALTASVSGGATLTPEGGALHRINIPGGTRLLVDTDGVGGVPVRGNGGNTATNGFGKAVIADVNDYYRNQASIDLDKLKDNVDATRSVTQATLTKGAIGYRRFDVIAGEKAMAVIRLADGTVPPFGATVMNRKKQETGIVNDQGNVYLSGINPGDTMTVNWDGAARCRITLPEQLPDFGASSLLLPCESIKEGTPSP